MAAATPRVINFSSPSITQQHHQDQDDDDDDDDDPDNNGNCQDITNPTSLYENLQTSNWPNTLKSLRHNPIEASIWIRQRRSVSSYWKMLPLHAAILYGAPDFVIYEILRVYPMAAREKDSKGRLPIHLAASVAGMSISSSKDDAAGVGRMVLNDLVRVYPESLWVADETGRTAMELVELLQLQGSDDDDDDDVEESEKRDVDNEKKSWQCCDSIVEQPEEQKSRIKQQQMSANEINGIMCYDEITNGLSASMDKEEEAPPEISTNKENKTKKRLLPLNHLEKFNNTILRNNKRRKKGPLMDMMRTVKGSMSFEGIISSHSREKDSHEVQKQCGCDVCKTAAGIAMEMSYMKRVLLGNDLTKPTLLFDYLVAGEWDKAMSRLREAPTEVKAWARRESCSDLALEALPLHASIVLGAPADLIIAFIDAFPTGAGEIDAYRSFPIHLAASCAASIRGGDRVVDRLCKSFRSGQHALDSNGRTPGDVISILQTAHEHRLLARGNTETESDEKQLTEQLRRIASFC